MKKKKNQQKIEIFFEKSLTSTTQLDTGITSQRISKVNQTPKKKKKIQVKNS